MLTQYFIQERHSMSSSFVLVVASLHLSVPFFVMMMLPFYSWPSPNSSKTSSSAFYQQITQWDSLCALARMRASCWQASSVSYTASSIDSKFARHFSFERRAARIGVVDASCQPLWIKSRLFNELCRAMQLLRCSTSSWFSNISVDPIPSTSRFMVLTDSESN